MKRKFPSHSAPSLFLQGFALLILLLPILSIAEKLPIQTETFTYKKVGALEIKLDVHRINDGHLRPVVVWCHGGALINGGRQGIGRSGRELINAGYCVVSLDYRLAPETKLPEIITDIEDAFRWIRKNGKKKFNGDTSKIAVLGGSAGGYLTMTAGFRIKPRVDCLVAFWGYGDLVGPWMSEPSPHPGHHNKTLSKESMKAVENGRPVANQIDRKGDGAGYYQTCRQLGIWTDKVSGFHPKQEAEKIYPFMAVKNIDADYPPILMIHGTKDTDVPHAQSEMMAQELKKHSVEHHLFSIENGEHGLRDAAREDIEKAYQAVLPFIARFVPPPNF